MVSAKLAALPAAFTAALLHSVTALIHAFAEMRAGDLRIPGPSSGAVAAFVVLLAAAVFGARLRRSRDPRLRCRIGVHGGDRSSASSDRAKSRGARGHRHRRRPGRLAARGHSRWQDTAHRCRRLAVWAPRRAWPTSRSARTSSPHICGRAASAASTQSRSPTPTPTISAVWRRCSPTSGLARSGSATTPVPRLMTHFSLRVARRARS